MKSLRFRPASLSAQGWRDMLPSFFMVLIVIYFVLRIFFNPQIYSYALYNPETLQYYKPFLNDGAEKFLLEDPLEIRKNYFPAYASYYQSGRVAEGYTVFAAPAYVLSILASQFTPMDTELVHGLTLGIYFLILYLISLYLIWKWLRSVFQIEIAGLSILALILGTNTLYYALYEPAHPALIAFVMTSLLLPLIRGFGSRPVLLGIVAGFVSVSLILWFSGNIIWVLSGLLILYMTGSVPTKKIRDFVFNKTILMVGFLSVMAFIYKQIAVPSDFWVRNSLPVFFLHKPQIQHLLFSYRNGWLVYTPVVLFAIPGLAELFRQNKKLFVAVLSGLVLFFYVCSSWWSWWNEGGMGNLFFTPVYPFLLFLIAWGFYYFFRSGNRMANAAMSFLLIFLFLNVYQTLQYRKGILRPDSMNRRAYYGSFLRWTTPRNYHFQTVSPNYQEASSGKYFKNEISSGEYRFREHQLRKYVDIMSKDTVWMDQIRLKSERLGLPLDSVIRMDAIWMYKFKFKKK